MTISRSYADSTNILTALAKVRFIFVESVENSSSISLQAQVNRKQLNYQSFVFADFLYINHYLILVLFRN